MASLRFALVVGCAALTACASLRLSGPVRAKTQEEAGSIHVAVLSVAPWIEYRAALQTKLDLSAADARALALKPTRTTADGYLDAMRFALAVAGPNSTSSQSRTATLNADGTTTTTGSNSQTSGPAATSAPAAPTENGLPAALRAAAPAIGADPGSEAIQTNKIIDALNQSVQLMDRYVMDAVQRRGYDGYVVRLQVSLLPNARRRPYDAYANIAFQDGCGVGQSTNLELANNEATTDTVLIQSLHTQADLDVAKFGATAKIEGGHPRQPLPAQQADCQPLADPIVVPLLATDEIETTLHARQEDQLRQFAFALSLLQANVGVGSQFDRVNETLRQLLGRDYNSLLTVARLTENTLRVRLGAAQSVESDYVMLPSTHDVSILLLVPKGYKNREIATFLDGEFRDVETGVRLPGRSLDQVIQETRDVLQQFPDIDASRIDKKDLFGLLDAAQGRSADEWNQTLKDVLPNVIRTSWSFQLRTELQGLLVGSKYAVSRFELPGDPGDRLPLSAQFSSLLDDGKQASIVVSNRNDFGRLRSAWFANANLTIANRTLLPTALSLSDDGQSAKLVFPSPKALGLIDPPPKGATGVAALPAGPAQVMGNDVMIAYAVEPSAPDAGVSMHVGPSVLWVSPERSGTLTVGVLFDEKKPAAKMVLDVSGADVESVSCNTSCSATTGVITVTKTGQVKLALSNVGGTVTLKGQGAEKSKELTIVLPVAQLAPPPEKKAAGAAG